MESDKKKLFEKQLHVYPNRFFFPKFEFVLSFLWDPIYSQLDQHFIDSENLGKGEGNLIN